MRRTERAAYRTKFYSNLSSPTRFDEEPKIIVLDYGSQYNQLITRRIREFGVFSELMSHRITAEEVKAMNPKGIILSGGPNSVYDEKAFGIDEKIFDLGIPVLGICYGMQLITYKLGGKVKPAKTVNTEKQNGNHFCRSGPFPKHS